LLVWREEVADFGFITGFSIPDRELVDEKVACNYEFLWCYTSVLLEFALFEDRA